MAADWALNPEDANFSEQLGNVTNGNGPAVVIEATGHPDAISTALDVAGRDARVVLLASTRGETPKVNFYRDVHKKGLILYGAHNSIRPRQESSPNFWTLEDDSLLLLTLIAGETIQRCPADKSSRSGRRGTKGISTAYGMEPRLTRCCSSMEQRDVDANLKGKNGTRISY